MKNNHNILIAFILNLFFAVFEFFGGFFTKSVAIISDSVHDLADAISIGLSYFLEKKSCQKPDSRYTYGYLRYSVLGALITVIILIVGSIFVIYNSVNRLINPVPLNYDGMIVIALFGTIINFIATYVTKDGESLNQKAVNLHMLEDVLGWIIVLIGAIVMKFTDWHLIDTLLSLLVALYIFYHAVRNLKEINDLFLEKTPQGISIEEMKTLLEKIKEIESVHHIHVWSMDGKNNYATMHIVTQTPTKLLKEKIKSSLKKYAINHVTIEFESSDEGCHDEICSVVNHHK